MSLAVSLSDDPGVFLGVIESVLEKGGHLEPEFHSCHHLWKCGELKCSYTPLHMNLPAPFECYRPRNLVVAICPPYAVSNSLDVAGRFPLVTSFFHDI